MAIDPQQRASFQKSDLPALGIILLFAILSLTAASRSSITFDECGHLVAGYSYLKFGDYRLNPESGRLPQSWAALPLLFGNYKFSLPGSLSWRGANSPMAGYEFLYGLGNDGSSMLWQARCMMTVLSCILGILIYFVSKSIFGRLGGLISLLVYTFHPSMLAHGTLVTTDMPVTLAFLASIASFWKMLHHPSWRSVLISCACLSVLFLTKMSAVLILPVFACIILIRCAAFRNLFGSEKKVRRVQTVRWLAVFIVHALAIYAFIWASFNFRYSPYPEKSPEPFQFAWPANLESTFLGRTVLFFQKNHLLPEAYLFGFSHVVTGTQDRLAFMNGNFSAEGWWHFFPYCIGVKTPIPILLMLLLGIWTLLHRWKKPPTSSRRGSARKTLILLYRLSPYACLFLVYWFVAMSSRLNIGERHLFPTYPFLFIFCGIIAYWFCIKVRVAKIGIFFLLLILIIGTFRISPYYFAFFNTLAGGPQQGYRRLVDSSLDWGQDFLRLADWLKTREKEGNSSEPVYLSSFSVVPPLTFGIQAVPLPSYYDFRSPSEQETLRGGTYCISATLLQPLHHDIIGPWSKPYEDHYQELLRKKERWNSMQDRSSKRNIQGSSPFATREAALFSLLEFRRLCAYLRHREPDSTIGYSILIYQLSDSQIREALNGPPAELFTSVQVKGMTEEDLLKRLR